MRLRLSCLAIVILVFITTALVGCNRVSISVKTAINEDGKAENAGVLAVPFLLVQKYKGGKGDITWADAALTDRFATGMLAKGYQVLDRSFIRKTLADNKMTPSGLFNEDRIPELGKLLGANTIVLGKYTIVELKDGRALDKRLHIRGIRVSDGKVVFSLSAMDTTRYRHLRVEQLVDTALEQLGAPTEGEEEVEEGEDEEDAK